MKKRKTKEGKKIHLLIDEDDEVLAAFDYPSSAMAAQRSLARQGKSPLVQTVRLFDSVEEFLRHNEGED